MHINGVLCGQVSGMKNKKTLVGVLLFVALCLLLGGCFPASESELEHDELPTVSILTIGEIGSSELERVSSALSEITVERLGCRVELRMIREDEYDERIDDLLLESNFADIFVCRNRTTMNKLMDGNYIYRLDRYLNRRPGLRKVVENEQEWEHVKSQGYTYGIPFGNNSGSAWGFLMRKDICDALGIDASSVSSLEQLHEVLLTVQANYPDLIPVVSDHGEVQTFAGIDLLIEGAGCFVVDGQVVNVCGMPEFLDRCICMNRWYEEGLILPNAQLNRDGRNSWMDEGLAFGSFAHLDRYTSRELEYATGKSVECAVLEDLYYADGASEESFVVYAYTEDVDLCLQVLQLIYADEEVLRLCIYGEEGVDYTLTPDGAVMPVEGGTYFNWCWAMRDRVPAPCSNQDPVWYEERTAPSFVFDNRAVANEIYQCGEVLEKYYEALCAGVLDPEEGVRRMSEELQTANMANVQTELERQWSIWKEENEI